MAVDLIRAFSFSGRNHGHGRRSQPWYVQLKLRKVVYPSQKCARHHVPHSAIYEPAQLCFRHSRTRGVMGGRDRLEMVILFIRPNHTVHTTPLRQESGFIREAATGQKTTEAIFSQIFLGGTSGTSVSSGVGIPVTKSISSHLRILVFLTIL